MLFKTPGIARVIPLRRLDKGSVFCNRLRLPIIIEKESSNNNIITLNREKNLAMANSHYITKNLKIIAHFSKVLLAFGLFAVLQIGKFSEFQNETLNKQNLNKKKYQPA